MAVYVDEIVEYGEVARRKGLRWSRWSHLTADTQPELHTFAARLGLRRSWFQNSTNYRWHYDVVPTKRARAIELGAVEVDRHGMAEIMARRRAALAAPPAGEPEAVDPDRPTRLTDAEIAALRLRARSKAGPFVDPKVVHAPRHFHSRAWAAAITGTPDFSLGDWPTMYLLSIAMDAEPVPPVTRAQLAEQAAVEEKARTAEVVRVLREERTAERHRAEAAAWVAAVRSCLVKFAVRENRHGRVRGGAREHLRHVVPITEAVSGRSRRHLAGRALCETPGRAKPLVLDEDPTDNPATCQRCLAYVSQIRTTAAP